MSSVIKKTGEPFSKVFIHSFKRLDGYRGDFSPHNLFLCLLMLPVTICYFRMSAMKAKVFGGTRSRFTVVVFGGGGGGALC